MVKKEYLMLIAGIVWIIAGVNILRIGLIEYPKYLHMANFILSIIVFLIFWFMIFSKLIAKHSKRIMELESEIKHPFYHFFDVKTYIIMFVMMTVGITLRVFDLVPRRFIAFFYTGLGFALFLAGLVFLIKFFTIKKKA